MNYILLETKFFVIFKVETPKNVLKDESIIFRRKADSFKPKSVFKNKFKCLSKPQSKKNKLEEVHIYLSAGEDQKECDIYIFL